MNVIAAAGTAARATGSTGRGATAGRRTGGTADRRIVGDVILLHLQRVAAGRGTPHHSAGGGVQPVAVSIARR